MTGYKWRLLVFPNATKCPYFLEPVPGLRSVDNKYLHRPGDIDYSCLSKLPSECKDSIRDYVKRGHSCNDPMDLAAYIASIIIVDRLHDPDFMPAQLD